MSNDKTTLADVQPGGRVRLGDQAERARFEAWHREKFKTSWQTGAPTRDMHNGVYADNYGPAEEQVRWEAWQAALAAQPSPGGQDAPFPWENFPAYLIDKCEGDTISEEGLQQALAAMAKDERYCLAARQPVGEPVAWQVNMTRSGRGWEACTQECYEETLRTGRYMGLPAGTQDVEVRKLYAAQTAQAVDLGALQGVAAEYQKWIEFHSAGNGDYDDFLRMHVFTDSQAVGK